MIRIIAALSILALTASASPPPTAAESQQVIEARQVYQSLQVQQVQQQMTYYNRVLTYGYAAESCGLRSPQWFHQLRGVYGQQYAYVLQATPLNAEQEAEVFSHSTAQIENPSPPPYICGRIQQDSLLPVLDQAVAMHTFQVASGQPTT